MEIESSSAQMGDSIHSKIKDETIVIAVPVRIAKQRDVRVNLDEVEVTFTTLQGGVWLRQDGEVREVKE